jgi:hypothetical protein
VNRKRREAAKRKASEIGISTLFVWLISHQPTVFSLRTNQPLASGVFLSEQISNSHQPNGQAEDTLESSCSAVRVRDGGDGERWSSDQCFAVDSFFLQNENEVRR